MVAARFNLSLHLCAIIGTLAFSIADGKPMLVLLALVGCVGSWLLSRGKRAGKPPALPRLAINLLVLATILNAALKANATTGGGESVVSTLGQFLVFLTLVKLMDRRGPRDDSQVITLAIFVAIAAMLTSADLLVGVLLAAFVPAAIATAMLWQLRAGEVAAARATAEGYVPVLAKGRNARRGFIIVCTMTVLIGCTMATVVFLLVPRLSGEFLGRFGMTRQMAIGYTETVKLGEAGHLSEDPTPVLDLLITGRESENLGSPGVHQYLRGSAKDRYDTKTYQWEEGPQHSRRDFDLEPRDFRSIDIPHQSTSVDANMTWDLQWPHAEGERDLALAQGMGSVKRPVQRITMRGDANNLFCLWRPLTIQPDRTVALTFMPGTGTIRRQQAWGPRLVYTVQSAAGDDRLPAPTAPLGFQEGPVRALADGVVRDMRGTPSSQRIASAIRDFLQSQYLYTTEMVGPPEGKDPIEFFLLDRKKGHCEYFASAMAAMCQSQGIPARVVTGYLATEFNTLTGQYLVRQSNAHAWAEAFIITDEEKQLGRWERFDPSPQAEIERLHKPAAGFLAKVHGWYDALEFSWSSSVVGFDNLSGQKREQVEREYSRTLYRGADRAAAWIRDFSAWVKKMRSDPSEILVWLRGLPVVVALIVGLTIGLRKGLRAFGSARHSLGRDMGYVPERPTGFYARALRTLERAGETKPDAMPPERFADELEGRAPGAAGALRRVAELYYRTRFGAAVLTPAEVAEGEARVRELRAELKRARSGRGA
jgi:transglutaminase-like putative cysteine protease